MSTVKYNPEIHKFKRFGLPKKNDYYITTSGFIDKAACNFENDNHMIVNVIKIAPNPLTLDDMRRLAIDNVKIRSKIDPNQVLTVLSYSSIDYKVLVSGFGWTTAEELLESFCYLNGTAIVSGSKL